ncbi:MAG: hypothetical protein QM729_10770 [Solirubrobacterales bacterium]
MRIRWRGVARVAAVVVVALVGVRLLPGLLQAPEPPPLGADVGLPKAKPAVVAKKPKARPRPKTRKVADAPASTARIGARTRRRPSSRRRGSARRRISKRTPEQEEPGTTPVPEHVAPAVPEAAPEPLPEAPPAPPSEPGDGSQEFAPH